jgi:hypothetical protein
MARRVYFSFHYDNDIWRVNVVRNSGTFKDIEDSGFFDHSLWEETKKKGEAELQKLIEGGLKNSTVSAVLAGSATWGRKWVRYELVKSLERGNGLMNIYIDKIKNKDKQTASRGYNPLDRIYFSINSDSKTASTQYYDGSNWQAYITIAAASIPQKLKDAKKGKLSEFFPSYEWTDEGHEKLGDWADAAGKIAGR